MKLESTSETLSQDHRSLRKRNYKKSENTIGSGSESSSDSSSEEYDEGFFDFFLL